MSILKEIYNYKLDFVEKQKKNLQLSAIVNELSTTERPYCFYKKLFNEKESKSIIGELKKASPSLGKFVNQNINLVDLAKIYEENQISCISVLTDKKYFNGEIEDLKNIKKNSKLPILRKDFIVDEYQIYESKKIGADCILIILAMLNQKEADRFSEIANDINLDTII